MYMTNWVLLMNIASLILTIIAAQGPSSSKLLKSHHVFYSITVMGNLIVMTVYWLILHKVVMENMAGDVVRQYHQIVVHALPGAVGLVNTMITNTVLKKDFFQIISGIASVFTLLYMEQVKQTNIYWFLDFKD